MRGGRPALLSWATLVVGKSASLLRGDLTTQPEAGAGVPEE